MASAVATRVLAPIGTAGKLFAFALDVGAQPVQASVPDP